MKLALVLGTAFCSKQDMQCLMTYIPASTCSVVIVHITIPVSASAQDDGSVYEHSRTIVSSTY